jgi:very-short-patch-repair endonuclease
MKSRFGRSQYSPLEGRQTKSDGVERKPEWQEKSLFPFWLLPKNKLLIQRARQLRKQGILSEVIFWKTFKSKDVLGGWDIDRQVIIGNFIVDFFIAELGLVIEIDGSSHNGKEKYDAHRQQFLESLNLSVVRYSDRDVLNDSDAVHRNLLNTINHRVMELTHQDK